MAFPTRSRSHSPSPSPSHSPYKVDPNKPLEQWIGCPKCASPRVAEARKVIDGRTPSKDYYFAIVSDFSPYKPPYGRDLACFACGHYWHEERPEQPKPKRAARPPHDDQPLKKRKRPKSFWI